MTVKIGNLGVDLSLESATFMRDLGKAAHQLNSSTAKMNQSIARFEKQVASVQRSLKTLERTAVAAFSVAGVMAFQKMATSALDVAASFEQMEIKLNALTKGRGKETLEELNKWALEMPVNTQQAVQTFSMMMAMGLDPTIEKMQILTDVGAIFGEETMPAIARQMGQISAKGKIMAQDLNVIAEAGVNARKYLQQAFGMTVEELQKSGIEIERIIEVIWNGLNADYGGAAKAAMKSWQGITAILKSYIVEIQRTAMNAGIFDALKNALSGVNDELKDYIENNSEMLKQDVKGYVDGVVTAAKMLHGIYSVLPDGVVGAAGAGLVGRILFGGWGPAKLVAALVFINTQMEQLGMGLSEFKKQNDRLGGAMSNIWDVITGKRDWNTGALKGAAADMLALQKAAERSSAAMQGIAAVAQGGGGKTNPPPGNGPPPKEPLPLPDSDPLGIWRGGPMVLPPDFIATMQDANQRSLAILAETTDAATISYETMAVESQTWVDGAIAGLAEYHAAASDTFRGASDFFGQSMSTMEDALVDFVATGKLEWRGLIDSILQDMARLVIRQNITGPLSNLLSMGISSLFGAGSAGSGFHVNQTAGGTTTAFGFADGGISSGPSTGYLATLHGREAVIPLPDGRGVPVEMKGGGGNVTNNYYIAALDVKSFEDRFGPSVRKITADGFSENDPSLWRAIGRR